MMPHRAHLLGKGLAFFRLALWSLLLGVVALPLVQEDISVAALGPAAETHVALPDGVLTAHRPLIRTPVAQDQPDDLTVPVAPGTALLPVHGMDVRPVSQQPDHNAAVQILPPLRGPPAV